MVKICKCGCSYCKQLRRQHDGPPFVQEGQNELVAVVRVHMFSFGCIIGLGIRTDTEMNTQPLFVLVWVL